MESQIRVYLEEQSDLWFHFSADLSVGIIDFYGIQYFKLYPKYCIKEIF